MGLRDKIKKDGALSENRKNANVLVGAQRRYDLKSFPISVMEELKLFMPKLTAQEQKQLAESILSEGVRDPLVVWEKEGKNILIDGHNRLAVIEANQLKFPVHFAQFKSLDEVKSYMVQLQIGKRNLAKWQIAYLRGLEYAQLKQGHGGERLAADGAKKTVEILAEKYGVGKATISRDYNFYLGVEKLPQDVRERLMNRVVWVKKARLEQLGSDKSVVEDAAVIAFIFNDVKLEDDNAELEDQQWFDERFVEDATDESPTPKKAATPKTFVFADYQQGELKRFKKVIRAIDEEDKKALAQLYRELAEQLEA